MPSEVQNVSVRNLVDLEAGTPLRKFEGDLDSYYPEERTFGTFVVLNFKNVKVEKSVEPYNFPIATISIKLSNKKNSGWGIFGESLAALLPEGQDIKDTLGMRYGLEMEEGHIYGQDRTTGDNMVGNPWKVYKLGGAIAGAAATTAIAEAKKLLDGKTRAEFNQLAYANPVIRQDPAFQRSITDKSFINSMLQLGEFTEDGDGVFHKAEGGGA